MPSVPVKIFIPVPYPVGPPPRVSVANGETPYQLIWEAAGAGVTFADDPPNEDFWWKSGSGQPLVTGSIDGKTLISNVYSNNGGSGSIWEYGLTIWKDGVPVTIDPVVENIPPTMGGGMERPGGRPGGGQPGGGQPGGGQPGGGARGAKKASTGKKRGR